MWGIVAAAAVGLACLFVLVLSALARRHGRQCADLIDKWASENSLRVIERTYVPVWHGPFWFRRWWTDQAVYRVVVENAEGETSAAHVRLGGWLRPTDITVRWQE